MAVSLSAVDSIISRIDGLNTNLRRTNVFLKKIHILNLEVRKQVDALVGPTTPKLRPCDHIHLPHRARISVMCYGIAQGEYTAGTVLHLCAAADHDTPRCVEVFPPGSDIVEDKWLSYLLITRTQLIGLRKTANCKLKGKHDALKRVRGTQHRETNEENSPMKADLNDSGYEIHPGILALSNENRVREHTPLSEFHALLYGETTYIPGPFFDVVHKQKTPNQDDAAEVNSPRERSPSVEYIATCTGSTFSDQRAPQRPYNRSPSVEYIATCTGTQKACKDRKILRSPSVEYIATCTGTRSAAPRLRSPSVEILQTTNRSIGQTEFEEVEIAGPRLARLRG
ncbi:hypothetical protein DL96DRAFT_1716513 [Flagelloscypha sp. PMI_526]|nr:hypothetical protein DL96DRAFT_1716513 [Flagelloscypha sp. PMI_526]